MGTRTIQSVPHPLEAGEAVSFSKPVAGNLPKWFLSGLAQALGGGENARQQLMVRCNQQSIREKWVGSLPESLRKSAAVAHVYPCWCALKMAEGDLVVHRRNGTIVAVDSHSDTVYLACATGDHKITKSTSLLMNVVNKNSLTDEDGNVVPIVAGDVARERCVHWVMLTKSDLETLKEKTGNVLSLCFFCSICNK